MTVRDRLLRFEVRKAKGDFTVIRQGGRILTISDGHRRFPKLAPVSSSALNLIPIARYVDLSQDGRLIASALDGDGPGFRVTYNRRQERLQEPRRQISVWVDAQDPRPPPEKPQGTP